MVGLMKALIINNIQNDYILPSGSVYVEDGINITQTINRLMMSKVYDLNMLIQCWNSPLHLSFASNNKNVEPYDTGILNGVLQTFFPAYCVCGTNGAEFYKTLLVNKADMIIRYGMDKSVGSYSAFKDNTGRLTGLKGYLQENKTEEVYVVGMPLDTFVKYTALDSVSFGFRTHVISDACATSRYKKGLGAIDDMRSNGVEMVKDHTLNKRKK